MRKERPTSWIFFRLFADPFRSAIRRGSFHFFFDPICYYIGRLFEREIDFFFTSIEEYQLQKLTGLAVKKGFFRVSGEHFCSAYRQSDFCVFLPFSSVI